MPSWRNWQSMANLKSTIETLSEEFARNVLAALKHASIEEIMGVNGGAPRAARAATTGSTTRATGSAPRKARPAATKRKGRLPRRSPAALAKVVDEIEQLLRKHADGLRAEQIRAELGLEAREMPRPLAEGLKDGRLTKTGDKRATTYFAGSGKAASAKKTAAKAKAKGASRSKRSPRRARK
jgi:hypothetical protein